MKNNCPPPKSFLPAEGVAWAKLCRTPPAFANQKRKRRGWRAKGIRYEQRVHGYLHSRYEGFYVASPWLLFQDKSRPDPRWCQPDGLLIQPDLGALTIIEVKYQHTSNAWWQVMRLYYPVLRHIFPEPLWYYRMCEVVKWYDPATAFPTQVRLTPDIARLQDGDFGVHIWKP